MADTLSRLLEHPEVDPQGPPVAWRAPSLLDLMGQPDYVRAPKLRPDALPDLEGNLVRRKAEAAQSPVDRWFDDHDKNMGNFMHQATGLVPGLHAWTNAYNAATDPEHPVTQEGRSIPKALAWGALGLGEAALGARAVSRRIAQRDNRQSSDEPRNVAPIGHSDDGLRRFAGIVAEGNATTVHRTGAYLQSAHATARWRAADKCFSSIRSRSAGNAGASVPGVGLHGDEFQEKRAHVRQ